MADTGWKAPTATGAKMNTWTDPQNAYSSEGTYASKYSDGDYDANSQSYETFDFGITGDNIINGIEVSLEGYCTAAPGSIYVQIWKNSSSEWTYEGIGYMGNTPDKTEVLGGSTSKWGKTGWVVSDFSNANYSIRIISAQTGQTIYIDQLLVKIYYTPYTAYQQSLDDSFALDESTSESIGRSADLTDVIIFTETDIKKAANVSFIQALNITASLLKESAYVRSLTGNFDINESLIRQFGESFSETFSIEETEPLLFAFKKILEDTLNISESLSKETGKTLEETLLVAESTEKTSEYKKSLLNSVSITEALTKSIQYQRMILETLNIVETLQKTTNISFSSALTITESLLRKSEYSKCLIENITFVESLTRIFDYKQNFIELIVAAEALSKKTDVSFSAVLSILESFSKISESKLRIIDISTLAEALSKESEKTFSEMFSIVESLDLFMVTDQKQTENLLISEQFKKAIDKNISENMIIQEFNILTSEFARIFSDSTLLTEEQKSLAELYETEVLSFSESLFKSLEIKRQERVSITEALKKALNMKKSDVLNVSETIFQNISMNLTDVLNTLESLTFSSYKSFIDSVQFLDSSKPDVNILKKLYETISIVDSIKFVSDKKLDTVIIVYEEVSFDSKSTLTDRVDIRDEFSKSISIGIIDNESLSDSLSHLAEFNLSISDMMTVSEKLKETGEVEPLKRRVYMFSKNNKIYLFKRK
ncbi:MAG: hypothetical protein WC346_09585 [Methanogenium sp.]|jgi:hypothetical protein